MEHSSGKMMHSVMIVSNAILLPLIFLPNLNLCDAALPRDNLDFILPGNEMVLEQENEKPSRRVPRSIAYLTERVEEVPSTANHTATLIFLHDLGESGREWVGNLKHLIPPYMKLICPTARHKKITYYNHVQLPAWWDKKSVDRYQKEDVRGIKDTAIGIQHLLELEIKSGIKPERIIIGGFSQGGALALQAALTFPVKLGGIIALSTWLPLKHEFEEEMVTANKDIPILQCHGDLDHVVVKTHGEQTAKILKLVSKNVDFRMYTDVMHTTSDEGFEDIKNFILKTVRPI